LDGTVLTAIGPLQWPGLRHGAGLPITAGMASKRTLNAHNLELLGAAALAELLIEVSSGSALIQRRLRLALAAADGAEGVAQAVRKRLTAIARATVYVDSRKRKALLADLEVQHQAITGAIAAADPSLAFELLIRFLELADGVLARSADTTGAVIGVFQGALADLAPLAAAASIQTDDLVEQVIELIASNGYGQFDGLIPSMAACLGEQGLVQLQRFFEAHGGPDATAALLQIAEARGDVDAYRAQFTAQQLRHPSIAADLALHLLAAGRPGEALAVLDGATAQASDWLMSEWGDARIAVLEGLGRSEEAQQQRWQLFCSTLSIPHLRAYLQRLDDFADLEAEERAFQIAEQHPQPLLALQFLIRWPDHRRAARHVLNHGEQWDGEAFEVLAPAAEQLSAAHPLAATILLRAMVVFALSTGRAKRYRHAAEHLRSCERLAAEIEDWQGLESQASFMGWLREAFARSWSFWQLLER
jgi:hypothetical protein